MANYYDWHTTLSYSADVTMVVGARGIGKTYWLRKQCIKDFMKLEEKADRDFQEYLDKQDAENNG